MTTPEVLRTSATPANTPSDTLLKSFRTTLKQRWQEFDSATMEEARKDPKAIAGKLFGMAGEADIKAGRDADADFQKAKATFEEAISTLETISTDAQLKQIIENPGRLSSVIITLQKHLDKADKEKAHNTVLSATLADLTKLKAQVTNNPEDTRAAEVARSAVPATVAAATAAGSVLAIPEVRGAIDEVKSEVTGEIKKAIGPWGMIFKGVKDIPAKEVAAQIKELSKDWSEKKWLDDPFDKLFAGIKLFFLRFQIRRAGLDLSKDMTPEEMRLAGIPVNTSTPTPRTNTESVTPTVDTRYGSTALFFENVFIKEKNLPVRNILQDTSEKSLKNRTLGDLRKYYTDHQEKKLVSEMGLSPTKENEEAVKAILKALFSDSQEKYIREAYLSGIKQPMNTPIPDSLKLQNYFEGAYGILRRMSTVGKALATQTSNLTGRINLSGNEVSFDNATDEADALSLVDGDKKLLKFAFLTGGTYKYKRGDSQILQSLNTDSQFIALYPDEGARKKALDTMKKFFAFVEKFYNAVETNENIHLGMNGDISRILNSRSLNLRGLMMIYLSFGDKDMNNFNEFSTIEQAEIYGYVLSLFGTEDNYSKGNLTSKYLTALEKSTKPIPKNVMKFMTDVLGYATNKALDSIWEGIKYFAGVAVDNPRLAAVLLGSQIPFIPRRDSISDLFF